MVCCSVIGCSSKAGTTKASFHSFPKDPVRLQEWICFCQQKNAWKPKMGSRMCSLHFDDKSWEPRSDLKRLKFDAVPSIKSNEEKLVFTLKEDSKISPNTNFPSNQKIMFSTSVGTNLSLPGETSIASFSKIQNMLNSSTTDNIAGT